MFDVVLNTLDAAVHQHIQAFSQSDIAFGAIAGAIAIVINARLALLAPLCVAGLELANWYDVTINPALADAAPALAAVFVALGALQSVVTALAGRDAAATLIGVVVGGVVLFALWRGPAQLLRLLTRGQHK